MLAGMLWTADTRAGWGTIQVMLPLLCVPVVMLTTQPLAGNARRVVLQTYTAAVFVVTIVGLVRWLIIPGLPHRAIVPNISHIRFALNCCVVVYLSVGVMLNGANDTFFRRTDEERAALRKQFDVDDDTPVVAFVGRFEPVKNVLMLPEIFDNIQRKLGRTVQFWAIGTGVQHSETVRLMTERPDINCRFWGQATSTTTSSTGSPTER